VLGDPTRRTPKPWHSGLRGTSLLEQVELLTQAEGQPRLVTRHTLHPATVEFIRRRFAGRRSPKMLIGGSGVPGGAGREVPYIETYLEAGITCSRLGCTTAPTNCSERHPTVAESRPEYARGLRILEPFLAIQSRCNPFS